MHIDSEVAPPLARYYTNNRRYGTMSNRTAPGWDGWVLYTSEEGYKYHWNHLTHESRWATEEVPTQNRSVELCLRVEDMMRDTT